MVYSHNHVTGRDLNTSLLFRLGLSLLLRLFIFYFNILFVALCWPTKKLVAVVFLSLCFFNHY